MSNNPAAKWDGLTATGTLPIGVFYAGQRHRTFTLRLSLCGDLIAAQEANPSAPVRLIALDLFRRQLLQLGDIPAEALTLDLLRAELTEIDQAVLEDADAALTKKLTPGSGDLPSGAPSNTPSSGTATD